MLQLQFKACVLVFALENGSHFQKMKNLKNYDYFFKIVLPHAI